MRGRLPVRGRSSSLECLHSLSRGCDAGTHTRFCEFPKLFLYVLFRFNCSNISANFRSCSVTYRSVSLCPVGRLGDFTRLRPRTRLRPPHPGVPTHTGQASARICLRCSTVGTRTVSAEDLTSISR